jgi:hypothetical protein
VMRKDARASGGGTPPDGAKPHPYAKGCAKALGCRALAWLAPSGGSSPLHARAF